MSSSQQSEPPPTVSHTGEGIDDAPEQPLLIRLSPLNLAPISLLVFAITFPVFGAPLAFGWLFAIPAFLVYWVLRIRTTVTADAIVTRRTIGGDRIEWAQLAGLSFPKRKWARATLTDGSTVVLPATTIDDLPQIAAASGGRIADPLAASDDHDSSDTATQSQEKPVS